MFQLCTYQKRISFGLCLLFLYYYGSTSFASHDLSPSPLPHSSTLNVNHLSLYMISLCQQSKMTIDHYLESHIPLNLFTFVLCSLALCEILFYLRWKYLEHYIHANISMFDTNPVLSHQRRDHLLKMAAKYATLHEEGMRAWCSTWFAGSAFEDICYDNATEMLSWAFMLKEKTKQERDLKERFIHFSLNCIESMTQHTFKRGYNPNISFVHNTDDMVPLRTTYRPFMFYFVLLIMQWLTDLIFIYFLRFEYEIVNGLKVWHKIQSGSITNKQSKPILLIHGLGVHYMPYLLLIYKLIHKSPENDLFCIEIPWTVMSLWHFVPKSIWKWFSDEASPSYIDSRLPATKRDFVEIVQQMEDLILSQPGSSTRALYERSDRNALKLQWTLIGHSYGSFLVAGIYDSVKKSTRCGDDINLPRLVLLDAVTLCLSQPVTVSFVALTAKDWITFLMQHLASRELMIACSLTKYFHWFEYNLFPEDLINSQVEHVVVTATADTLLPNDLITKGIDQVNEKGKDKGYKKIHQISFENLHHAMWLVSIPHIQRIVDAI